MPDSLLLAGGLDSVAHTALLKPKIAITCDYGQLAADGEIRAAAQVDMELGLVHHIITVNCKALGSGDLAGTPPDSLAPVTEWWPFRNQLLITLSAMLAVQLGANRLLLGTVKSDAFHIDGTPHFVDSMDAVCRMQEGGIGVAAPAINMTSAELIRASEIDLRVLSWGHSCHKSSWACGHCRGCCKHRLVMQELGYESY